MEECDKIDMSTANDYSFLDIQFENFSIHLTEDSNSSKLEGKSILDISLGEHNLSIENQMDEINKTPILSTTSEVLTMNLA